MRASVILRRGGWTLADQALSSLGNLAVTLLVARATSVDAFGAFSLAYISYMCALGLSQAMASEPLIIRFSAAGGDIRRKAIREATGTAIVISGLASVSSLVAGLAVGGTFGSALVALAIVMPGLLLQDCWRFVFFTAAEPRKAAINDSIWCFAELLAFLAVFSQGAHPAVSTLILAWGSGAWVAALAGPLQSGILPSPRKPLSWLRVHLDLIPALSADFLMMTAGVPLSVYVLGAVGGLRAVGGLEAAQTLLGPVAVAMMAARVFAVPECVRLRHRAYGSLPGAIKWLAVVSMAFAALYGVVLGRLVPYSVGIQLLGRSWPSARQLLLPLALMMVARAATIAAMVGLRALDDPRRLLRARLISSPLIFAGGAVGAILGEASGTAIGLALAQWLGVSIWWIEFRRSYAAKCPADIAAADPLVAGPAPDGEVATMTPVLTLAAQGDPALLADARLMSGSPTPRRPSAARRRPSLPRRRFPPPREGRRRSGSRALAALLVAVAGMYVAVIIWASNTRAANVENALIIFPVLAAAASFLVPLAVRKEPDRRLRHLIVIAFAVKMLMVVVSYVVTFKVYRTVDANLYHEAGITLAQQFRQHNFSYSGAVVGSGVIEIAVGVIYSAFGPTRLGASLIFGTASFWGSYFFFRAFATSIPRGNTYRYAILIFYLPSVLFWTAGIGKDSWVLFFLGLTTYQIARVLSRQPSHLSVMVLGIVALSVVRPHIALLLVGGFAIGFLIRVDAPKFFAGSMLSPVFRAAGFLAIILLALLVASQTQRFLKVEQVDTASVSDVLTRVTTSSSQGGSSFDTGNVASPLRYPSSIVNVLFRPFPNEAGSPLALMASVEGLAMLALCALSRRRLSYALRRCRRYPYLILALVYCLLFIYAFASIANFGLIVRERTQLWPFLFVLLAAAPPKTRRGSPEFPEVRLDSVSPQQPTLFPEGRAAHQRDYAWSRYP